MTPKRLAKRCNFFSEGEFTPWLTAAVVLLPTSSAGQDESLEQNEDKTNASQRIHAGGNHDRGGYYWPADRCGRTKF